ncbi:MAG TPA: hypothetical protein VFX96_08335 [Pyrinomonadaceae bacterium]|nr:hypothetical protein [Pyrinomonadaceae bacterium]
MSLLKALGGGLVGACALTLLHEVGRRVIPNAPRMDILGMRAIKKSLRAVGEDDPPVDLELHDLALLGDLVSNSAYYALVGVGGRRGVWERGALLGLAAGVGAVALPGPLGLGRSPSERTPQTQAMTIGWYLAGGLAAAAAFEAFSEPGRRPGRGAGR